MDNPLHFDNLDEFLTPASSESPCGLGFAEKSDEEYLRIEREVENASDVREWVNLKKDISPLLKQTKDFRLLAFYARTLVNTEKVPFAGLSESLFLAKKYIEDYWDCAFPLEDSEDLDDRFTDRLNALGELGAWTTIVLPLTKKRELLSFKGMQAYSLGDLLKFQRGEEVEGKQPPKQFVKALSESELAQIEMIIEFATLARSICSEIKVLVSEKIEDSFIEFDKYLSPMLEDVLSVLADLSPNESSVTHSGDTPKIDFDGSNKLDKSVETDSKKASLTVINSRDDVVSALDMICEYYVHHEPSSPLPLLLKRARGIVHKDFLEVLEELVPDSVSMTEPVFGRKEETDD